MSASKAPIHSDALLNVAIMSTRLATGETFKVKAVAHTNHPFLQPERWDDELAACVDWLSVDNSPGVLFEVATR